MMSTGGMHPYPEALYYWIAFDAVESAKAESDEFKRKQLVTTAIVFSVVCLETYINQEFIRHQETKKILEDDDHLRLETKWLLLPLLLGSQTTFQKGVTPFQTFQDLIYTRNQRLVHFKPGKETRESGREYKHDYFGDIVGSVPLAEKYLKCVGEMIRELNRITIGRTEIPAFLEGQKYLSKVWASSTANIESVQQRPTCAVPAPTTGHDDGEP